MSDFRWTEKDIIAIRERPATTLGHMIGKTKLTSLHDKWIKDVWDSGVHEGLQGHRGSYKTTAITEIGIIRWLLFWPNERIALIRKPFTEASKTLLAIRNYMRLEPVQSLFKFAHGFYPREIRGRDRSVTYNFKQVITKEGNVDAYGPDGSITGNHYDVIHCDDIVTLKDRISKAEREKTKDAFREIITNIVDPGKPVHNVGTPWHKTDAWTILPPKYKYDTKATGILSEEEIQEKRSKTTKVLYSINYDLKHIVDDDAIFIDPEYKIWKPNVRKVFAHIDAKFQGDHTGAFTFMAERPDGMIQAKGFLFYENIKDKIKWAKELYKKYYVKKLWIENNPDKGYTADYLREEDMKVEDYHEDMNKDYKIQFFLKHFWDRLIWAHDNDEMYMAQILDYREGEEPNDAPDSAASLLRKAFYKGKAASANALYKL